MSRVNDAAFILREHIAIMYHLEQGNRYHGISALAQQIGHRDKRDYTEHYHKLAGPWRLRKEGIPGRQTGFDINHVTAREFYQLFMSVLALYLDEVKQLTDKGCNGVLDDHLTQFAIEPDSNSSKIEAIKLVVEHESLTSFILSTRDAVSYLFETLTYTSQSSHASPPPSPQQSKKPLPRIEKHSTPTHQPSMCIFSKRNTIALINNTSSSKPLCKQIISTSL